VKVAGTTKSLAAEEVHHEDVRDHSMPDRLASVGASQR